MELFYDHIIFLSFIVLVAIIYLWDVIDTVKKQSGTPKARNRQSPPHRATGGWILPGIWYSAGTKVPSDDGALSTGVFRDEPRRRHGTRTPSDRGLRVE